MKQSLAREEREQEALRECTFAPMVHQSKEKRGLEEFLEDQRKHVDKKRESVNKMKKDNQEKEEMEVVAQPKINEKSRVMLSGKKGETLPVHERLYGKSKKVNEEKEVNLTMKKSNRNRML